MVSQCCTEECFSPPSYFFPTNEAIQVESFIFDSATCLSSYSKGFTAYRHTEGKSSDRYFYSSSKSQLISVNAPIIHVRTIQKKFFFSSIVLKHYHLRKWVTLPSQELCRICKIIVYLYSNIQLFQHFWRRAQVS